MRSYERYTVKARTVDGNIIIGCLIVPPYVYGKFPDVVYVTTDGGKSKFEVHPHSICANTGIGIHGYKAYEFDVFSFCDEVGDEGIGYIAYDAIAKRYIMATNPITNETREITKCHNIRYTGRNVKTSKADWYFVVDSARQRSVYHPEEGGQK